MDSEDIFRDVRLSKMEMTVLRFIQNDPEQCTRQGAHAVAEQHYSNLSSLVRLAEKLKFNGWLGLVYPVKFNVIMPKLDVTNDIDYMSVQPEKALTLLLASLRQQRTLIHGSSFSQLTAQYIYNKFLVTDVNASLTLWPDYEILEQKDATCFDSIWIISKSGRSSSAFNWVKALEGKEISLVCFTGDCQSPLTRATDTAFIIHDPQRFDDDIYWSNPFSGYYVLGFERLLKMWFTSLCSDSQPPLNTTRVGGVPGWRLAPCPDYRMMRQFCREAAYAWPGLHKTRAAPFVAPLSAVRVGGAPGWRLAPYPGYRVIRQFCRVSAYA